MRRTVRYPAGKLSPCGIRFKRNNWCQRCLSFEGFSTVVRKPENGVTAEEGGVAERCTRLGRVWPTMARGVSRCAVYVAPRVCASQAVDRDECYRARFVDLPAWEVAQLLDLWTAESSYSTGDEKEKGSSFLLFVGQGHPVETRLVLLSYIDQ